MSYRHHTLILFLLERTAQKPPDLYSIRDMSQQLQAAGLCKEHTVFL